MADSTMPAAAQETLKSFSEIDYEAEIISFFQELAKWPAKIIRANKEAFTNMTINRWVRLVVIVGGYILIRPYIDKLFARMNGKDFQEEVTVDPKDKLAKAKMSANELRGRVQELGDSSDDDEETAKASGKDVEFGKKARKRQRQMLRKQLEAEEKARLEAEEELEDKELEEFLLRNSNWDGNPNPHALTLDD